MLMHSYKHHLGDWASHTRGLTFTQLGAYHLLIEAYYTSEKPLPGNVAEVCRSIGAATTNERKAVSTILVRFFVHDVTRNCWSHNRCDEEIAKYQEHCDKQQQKIAKRWEIPQLIKSSTKAIETRNRQETQIRGFPLVEAPRTSTNGNEPSNDTAGIPPVIPNQKPVTFNTPNTHGFNAESIAAEAQSVCVEKGLKIDKNNSLLLALIHRGAGIADFAEAAAIAAAQGKGFAYVAGIVNNRLSVATEYAREGPKTGLGSTITDPRMVWYQRPKNK